MTAARIRLTCLHCGSDEIVRDAVATWDTINQGWEMAGTLDGMSCNDCGEEFDEAAEEPIT